ncbi:hypothetical protein B0H15DRAFT_180214 [Mycena belliarum]|uniref:Uncharacterized protein n=1 Tax=Mycena belliarum TaxID=1033014 RepID=A0AAD6U8D5_9AGAR|nr:hypothetical protein B0H15DRAFT_180214 [Mycena belliae]
MLIFSPVASLEEVHRGISTVRRSQGRTITYPKVQLIPMHKRRSDQATHPHKFRHGAVALFPPEILEQITSTPWNMGQISSTSSPPEASTFSRPICNRFCWTAARVAAVRAGGASSRLFPPKDVQIIFAEPLLHFHHFPACEHRPPLGQTCLPSAPGAAAALGQVSDIPTHTHIALSSESALPAASLPRTHLGTTRKPQIPAISITQAFKSSVLQASRKCVPSFWRRNILEHRAGHGVPSSSSALSHTSKL